MASLKPNRGCKGGAGSVRADQSSVGRAGIKSQAAGKHEVPTQMPCGKFHPLEGPEVRTCGQNSTPWLRSTSNQFCLSKELIEVCYVLDTRSLPLAPTILFWAFRGQAVQISWAILASVSSLIWLMPCHALQWICARSPLFQRPHISESLCAFSGAGVGG